jgi:hypothetical protein
MAAAAASLSAAFGFVTSAFSRSSTEPANCDAAAAPRNSLNRSQGAAAGLGGVGIVFSKDSSGCFVVRSVQDGSCAAASGISPNDVIVSVDGFATKGLSIRQVAAAISGQVGSQVVLTIQRGTQAGTVVLVRAAGVCRGTVGSSSMTPTRLSSQPSPAAADSVTLSSPPTERNEEIICMTQGEFSEGARAAAKCVVQAPAAAPSRDSGACCGARTQTKRASKEFERSQLFLEIKDVMSLNAIVAADCQHLIDDLESAAAFESARGRLIASRTRLPLTEMKKASFIFCFCFCVHPAPLARLRHAGCLLGGIEGHEAKCHVPGDEQQNPPQQLPLQSRIAVVTAWIHEHQPMLRERLLPPINQLIQRPDPHTLHHLLQASIAASVNDNRNSTLAAVSAVASVAKSGKHLQ